MLTGLPPRDFLEGPWRRTTSARYTAGKFALDLGRHSSPGWIQSVEGGHATADVVVEKVGADIIQHKHIAGVKYEDITVNCGTGMSKAFYEWIQASLDHKHTR